MAACLLPQRLYDARSPLADGIWNSSLYQQLAMLQAGHCWPRAITDVTSPPLPHFLLACQRRVPLEISN
jgi:hypothetical protein